MAKKKNKTQNEQAEQPIDVTENETATSEVLTEETVQITAEPEVTEVGFEQVQEVDKSEEPEPKLEKTEEPKIEEIPIKEDVPVVEKAQNTKTEEVKAEEKLGSLESIAKAILKADNNLNTSFASINRGTQSLLIKQSGGVHCFCRVVARSRSHNGQEWEAEFLANVPPQIHSKLVKILKDVGVPDSKRLFFNPSGML